MNQLKIPKNYLNSFNKRKLEIENFQLFRPNINHLLCLAGPQPYIYQKLIPSQILRADSYETNKDTYCRQKYLSKDLRFNFHYGEITNEFLTENTFIDADFCTGIDDNYQFLLDIKDYQFQVTLSMRPVGEERTINRLFYAMEEDFRLKEDNIYITNKNSYKINKYFDTSSMISIFKL